MKNIQIKNISMRRAKKADSTIVKFLQDGIFYDDFQNYGFCPNYGRSQEWTETLIKRRDVYLIYDQEELAGIIVIRVHGMECHISSIGIKKEYRGKRIGTYVMEQMESRYHDAWVFTLDTYWDKKDNIRFYKNLGYEITGTQMEGSLKLVYFRKKAKH